MKKQIPSSACWDSCSNVDDDVALGSLVIGWHEPRTYVSTNRAPVFIHSSTTLHPCYSICAMIKGELRATYLQVHGTKHVESTIGHRYSSCADCPSWRCVLIRCDSQSVHGKILKKKDISDRKKNTSKIPNIMDATIATIAREPLTYTASGAVRPASLNRETYASLMGVLININ